MVLASPASELVDAVANLRRDTLAPSAGILLGSSIATDVPVLYLRVRRASPQACKSTLPQLMGQRLSRALSHLPTSLSWPHIGRDDSAGKFPPVTVNGHPSAEAEG